MIWNIHRLHIPHRLQVCLGPGGSGIAKYQLTCSSSSQCYAAGGRIKVIANPKFLPGSIALASRTKLLRTTASRAATMTVGQACAARRASLSERITHSLRLGARLSEPYISTQSLKLHASCPFPSFRCLRPCPSWPMPPGEIKLANGSFKSGPRTSSRRNGACKERFKIRAKQIAAPPSKSNQTSNEKEV